MIVDIRKLTDFTSDHGLLAEIAVQALICNHFELTPGVLTIGYNPEYDFGINNSLIELKFSRNNFQVTKIEVAREDKRPSGLSLTKSDLYAFFSQDSQTTAKLRLIRTADIYAYYLTKPTLAQRCSATIGDHSGRIELPLNMGNLDNLGVGVCKYDNGLFHLDTFNADPYAIDNIQKYIK